MLHLMLYDMFLLNIMILKNDIKPSSLDIRILGIFQNNKFKIFQLSQG